MLKITFNVGEQVIMEGQEDSSSDSEADYEILDTQYDTIGDDASVTMDANANAEAAQQADYIPKNLIKVKMNGIIWVQDTPIDIDDQDCLWVFELKKTSMNKSCIHSKTMKYEWSYPDFLNLKKYINRSQPNIIYVFISILTHEIPSYYHKLLLSLGSRLNPEKIAALDLYGWYYVCTKNKQNNANSLINGDEYKNVIQRGHFKNNQAIFGLLNNSGNIIMPSQIAPSAGQPEKQQWSPINENVYPVILQDNGTSNSNSSTQEYTISI